MKTREVVLQECKEAGINNKFYTVLINGKFLEERNGELVMLQGDNGTEPVEIGQLVPSNNQIGLLNFLTESLANEFIEKLRADMPVNLKHQFQAIGYIQGIYMEFQEEDGLKILREANKKTYKEVPKIEIYWGEV